MSTEASPIGKSEGLLIDGGGIHQELRITEASRRK